jgi:hypothetical protein
MVDRASRLVMALSQCVKAGSDIRLLCISQYVASSVLASAVVIARPRVHRCFSSVWDSLTAHTKQIGSKNTSVIGETPILQSAYLDLQRHCMF